MKKKTSDKTFFRRRFMKNIKVKAKNCP